MVKPVSREAWSRRRGSNPHPLGGSQVRCQLRYVRETPRGVGRAERRETESNRSAGAAHRLATGRPRHASITLQVIVQVVMVPPAGLEPASPVTGHVV